MKAGILAPPNRDLIKKWIIACENMNVEYTVIDLISSNWFETLTRTNCDFLLTRPPGNLMHEKNMYDERLYIIDNYTSFRMYPTYTECFLYENKKLLSYFLKANNIPHPATQVFYSKPEALDFITTSSFPIVGKTSIGASGSGVRFINTHSDAVKYINQAFSKHGTRREVGPSKATGSPSKWIKKSLSNPGYLMNKLRAYRSIHSHGERDFVLFQEYIPHTFEWRAARIGESYFAHKKVLFGSKASGSKEIDYVEPPVSLLDFVHELCERFSFTFMAIDILEYPEGKYLVNELQTLFGHVQDFIMSISSIPGRYVLNQHDWVFQPGDFNSNESYDLRLKTIIRIEEGMG